MRKFNIFYSWQSNLNPKLNNYYIKDCIQKALKELKQDVNLEIRLDQDTKNKTGSPDIVKTIFDKIDLANIFIADVTIVNKSIFNYGRKSPNPNVLVELGYALKTLGKERIILIINKKYCKIDELPFDIKQNRITQYHLSKESNIKNINLKDILKKALKDIIKNYDAIESDANKSNIRQHDLKIFREYESKFSESLLKEIIEFIPTNLRSNKFYYIFLDNILSFAENSSNNYINEELNKKFKEFVKATSKLKGLCGITMIVDDYPGTKYEEDFKNLSEVDLENIYRSQRYYVPKEPFDHDWKNFQIERGNAQKELNDASDLTYETYEVFRMEIKKNLFV